LAFVGKDSEYNLGEPVLKPSDLVIWKRRRNIYNFSALPSLAIISVKKNVFAKAVSPFTTRIKGIGGVHYNYKSKILMCSEFGSGSPALIMLLEELFALGVKKFIFIGVAGMLDDSVKENKTYIVSNVFSSSGSTYYYFKNEEIECYERKWFEETKDKCLLNEKIVWSTDCPFRETTKLINHYKSKSCSLVDMESAALYAFSQYYNTPSISLLVGADRLTETKWEPPKNMDLILKSMQNMVSKLLEF